MARTPDGPAPPPAVAKLRLRYAKRGRLRFTSHRDFQRAFERALRRSDVPMAYSAGFTPHPKISYANAAPTGAASEAEYLEISLTRACDPAELRERLDAALPAGLDIVEVVPAEPGALADRLTGSVWLLELPGVDGAAAAAAVSSFLAAAEVPVKRLTKTGTREVDARSAVVRLEIGSPADLPASTSPLPTTSGDTVGGDSDTPGSCEILRLVVRHTTPAVRPDDVLTALRAVADLAPTSPPRVTRLAQGPLDEEGGSVADPLTADRDAADT